MSVMDIVGNHYVDFIVAGLVGMIVHYGRSYSRGNTGSSLVGYFSVDNLPATITTFGAFFMAVVTAINSGVVTDDMSIGSVLYAGMSMGYVVDSGFNVGVEKK